MGDSTLSICVRVVEGGGGVAGVPGGSRVVVAESAIAGVVGVRGGTSRATLGVFVEPIVRDFMGVSLFLLGLFAKVGDKTVPNFLAGRAGELLEDIILGKSQRADSN